MVCVVSAVLAAVVWGCCWAHRPAGAEKGCGFPTEVGLRLNAARVADILLIFYQLTSPINQLQENTQTVTECTAPSSDSKVALEGTQWTPQVKDQAMPVEKKKKRFYI